MANKIQLFVILSLYTRLIKLCNGVCRPVINEINVASVKKFNPQTFIELSHSGCTIPPQLRHYGLIVIDTVGEEGEVATKIVASFDFYQSNFNRNGDFFLISLGERLEDENGNNITVDLQIRYDTTTKGRAKYDQSKLR